MRALILAALLSGCACTPAPVVPQHKPFERPPVNTTADPDEPWGPEGPALWTGTCFPTWPTQPCQKYT